MRAADLPEGKRAGHEPDCVRGPWTVLDRRVGYYPWTCVPECPQRGGGNETNDGKKPGAFLTTHNREMRAYEEK